MSVKLLAPSGYDQGCDCQLDVDRSREVEGNEAGKVRGRKRKEEKSA